MARGEVRSGRSHRHAPAGTGPDTTSHGSNGEGAVVVVGAGPVARAVTDWWTAHPSRPVRSFDVLPTDDVPSALAGASAVVVVAHTGDLAAAWAIPPERRRRELVERVSSAITGARAARVRHVVVISSAMVHGAVPGRDTIHDGDPLPKEPVEGIVGDLLAIEAVVTARSWRRGPLVTVLRPAGLVGPGVDTMLTRHFEAPRLLAVRGVEREWQLLHVDDLAAAVGVVLDQGLTGALTVGAHDTLTAQQVLAAAGMRPIELAAVTAFGTAERLHRVGVLPAPSSELAYTVYPWTVASDGLRAAGWSARVPSAECLEVLLDGVQRRTTVAGRRVGAKDATALGAAGAAVALIGTAAVLRQARARRAR